MAYGIISSVYPFDWISGPHEDDAGVQPGASQKMRGNLPGSFLAGGSVWFGPNQCFIDPPPPAPVPVTAYEIAVAAGFVGSEAQWRASLKGATGNTGPQGVPGNQGPQGIAGPQGPTGPAGDTFTTRATKTADEGRSTATLADDASLTIAVAANAVYAVDVLLAFNVSNIAADAKWTLTGPAGAVLMASESSVASTVAVFGLAAVRTVLVASVASFLVQARGILTTTNAGNLTLQWAQNTLTAGSPTTLKRGSMLQLVKLA